MEIGPVVAAVLLALGAGLCLVGAIGLLRFPDFYTRLHAASITDTLGAGLFLAGLAMQFGASLSSLKIGMVFLFLLFTSPTACHALAKAAWRSGLAPWTPAAATGAERAARRRPRRARRR